MFKASFLSVILLIIIGTFFGKLNAPNDIYPSRTSESISFIENTSFPYEESHQSTEIIASVENTIGDIVILNQVTKNILSSDHGPNVNSERHEAIQWNWNEIIHYFGDHIENIYIPDEMYAISNNYTSTVYSEKSTDKIVWDELELYYVTSETEWELPQFCIRASKLGLICSTVYVWPEDLQVSIINNIEVMIGYNTDNQKNRTSYVAYFKYDGVEYEIVSSFLSEETFVKVIKSILT